MKAAFHLEKLIPVLRREGLDQVEVYAKEGRSRRFEIGPQGVVSSHSTESGWAVRASRKRASFFAAGSGAMPEEVAWPAADGFGLSLPRALPVPKWIEPPGLDAPLLVEGEGVNVLTGIESSLRLELPQARLIRAVLDDGASRAEIASTTGIRVSTRGRAAVLFVEVVAEAGGERARLSDLLAERESRAFNPKKIGVRLADRLAVRLRGRPAARDRVPCLLSPPVAARLLGAMLPLFLDGALASRSQFEVGAAIASKSFTVVDDPSLHVGLLSSPVDGEGVPARRVKLVDEGVLRRLLSDWRTRDPVLADPAGQSRRPSWREPPRVGPSHLYVAPDPDVSALSLLAAMPRGFYPIELLEAPRVDLARDSFRLVTAGFSVRGGKAAEPISRAVMTGRVSSLLRGVSAVARDVQFFMLGGMLGAPSMLVQGLDIAPDE